jgi:zinc transporter ZupT
VKQIVVTLVCGVLLGFGSCYGFLSTANFNGPSKQPETAVFVIGFFVGVALVLAAGMLTVVAIIMFFVRAVRGEQ